MLRARSLLAAAVATALLAGCAGTTTTSTLVSGDTLTIYTSLPLRGERVDEGRGVLAGERFALHEAAGRVGDRTVDLVALDDTDPSTGRWAPGQVAANARRATQNPTAVAYVGDLDSGASAVSVPITNTLALLQVSPLSGYTGLTQPADKGEPDKYYPVGRRNFARLVPTDRIEAGALAGWIRDEGVDRVVVAYDGLQEGLGQAGELVKALRQHAIAVADIVRVDPHGDAADVAEGARDLSQAGAPAIVYAGGSTASALALLQAFHDREPAGLLFATSGVSAAAAASGMRSAAGEARLTSPMLPIAAEPPAAGRMARRYRRITGATASPAVLYGYEAMRGVLAALRRAGSGVTDRQSIVDAYFRTTAPDSVLGPYTIDSRGDTTASRYGAYTVQDGRLRLDRILDGTR